MRKWLTALVVIILVSIVGTAVYLSTRPVESIVTGGVWFTSEWGMGIPPPSSEFDFENSIFNATISQPINNLGARLIQQGDSPHSWWNLNATKASLKNEITIYRDEIDGSPSLMLDLLVTTPLFW